MKQETKHTPGPWEVSDIANSPTIFSGGTLVCDASIGRPGTPYVKLKEEEKANAEFIVKACNSYYDMLEALKMASPIVELYSNRYELHKEELIKMKAAISKAEGGKP